MLCPGDHERAGWPGCGRGQGWGRGQQAGLGAELGTHQTSPTEHGPQKGSGSTASSATWEGEDEEQAHLPPNPKRQQPWVPLGGWQQGWQWLCHRPGGCHHLSTTQRRAGRTALPFMSEPSRNHSFPSPLRGDQTRVIFNKGGDGRRLQNITSPSLWGRRRQAGNAKISAQVGAEEKKISARGLNGLVLVGTLLPTAHEVRGGVSARAQALNETGRKNERHIQNA